MVGTFHWPRVVRFSKKQFLIVHVREKTENHDSFDITQNVTNYLRFMMYLENRTEPRWVCLTSICPFFVTSVEDFYIGEDEKFQGK